MGQKDRDTGKSGLSRRDFLKASAAGAAAVGIAEFAQVGPAAAAVTGALATYHSTCPYCSASCGQLVAVDTAASAANDGTATGGKVIDVYGDWRSPFNAGGLCAKGAGGFQLVNNPRRVGAWTSAELNTMTGSTSHPVNNVFRADTTNYPDGVAYKRVATGPWTAMSLDSALTEIVNGDSGPHTHDGLKAYRGDETYLASVKYNSKGVAFFGCSHVNNEQNYLLKKITANFGTNNCEHQARI